MDDEMWKPPDGEGEFLDYEFTAEPYGRFVIHYDDSEVEPDESERTNGEVVQRPN